MRKQPNKKMIGFFTVSGIVLFMGIMMLFIGDKIFLRDSDLSVLYFNESLKGLRVGSPVVFRGVEVGKVAKIDIITDLDDMTFKLPVYINIQEPVFKKYGHHEIKSKRNFIEQMVNKGLKGRLTSQNFLTGQLMVELEILPDAEAKFRGGFGKVVEIPTVLSSMGEISKGLQDLPIRPVLDNFNVMLSTINEKLPNILNQAEGVTTSLNKLTSGNLSEAKADTIDNLNKTFRDISEAAQAMRNLADYLGRHPEAILKGKSSTY